MAIVGPGYTHRLLPTHTTHPVGRDTCPATSKLQQIAASKVESAKQREERVARHCRSAPLCTLQGEGHSNIGLGWLGGYSPCLLVSLAKNACAFVSRLSFCRDLRFNHIEELPANAFNGLGQLTTLFLNDNELAYVHEDAFKDLNALRFLYLSKNRLSRLPAGIFRHLPKLEVL